MGAVKYKRGRKEGGRTSSDTYFMNLNMETARLPRPCLYRWDVFPDRSMSVRFYLFHLHTRHPIFSSWSGNSEEIFQRRFSRSWCSGNRGLSIACEVQIYGVIRLEVTLKCYMWRVNAEKPHCKVFFAGRGSACSSWFKLSMGIVVAQASCPYARSLSPVAHPLR